MSPRVRIIAATSVLVVLFVIGAVRLVLGAASTEGPDTASSEQTTGTSGGAPADPGATDPGATDPGATDPGATDPGTTDPGTGEPGTEGPGTAAPGPGPGGGPPGGGPPKPARSVRVAGAALDGNLDGACALTSLPGIKVTVRIDAIRLVATDESGQPVEVLQDDAGGCPGERSVPLCQGYSFGPGAEACEVGVGFGDSVPAGSYRVAVELELRAHCTSPAPVPCDQVGPPAPTPADPVEAVWSDVGPEVEVSWDGPPTPPEPTEPTEQTEPTEPTEPTDPTETETGAETADLSPTDTATEPTGTSSP